MTAPMVEALESPVRRTPDALQALKLWTPRHLLVAFLAAVAVALVIGIPSVLIPNPVFGREIPPVWWNYPVWLLTSVLSGMLIATYLAPGRAAAAAPEDQSIRRSSRWGLAGGLLAWFAVGCPVCNKLVLLALGYSGALAWFAPAQAYLAAAGLLVTAIALYFRLKGQISCPVGPRAAAPGPRSVASRSGV